MNKYGNRKTEVDGILFDSAKEANRYRELCMLQHAGEIADLQAQCCYPLEVNGQVVGHYIADFLYRDNKTGRQVVEDVKGGSATKTALYRLKKKMLFAQYGVKITEV